MTLSDLVWLSKIFNYTKRRVVSLRQLSLSFLLFMMRALLCKVLNGRITQVLQCWKLRVSLPNIWQLGLITASISKIFWQNFARLLQNYLPLLPANFVEIGWFNCFIMKLVRFQFFYSWTHACIRRWRNWVRTSMRRRRKRPQTSLGLFKYCLHLSISRLSQLDAAAGGIADGRRWLTWLHCYCCCCTWCHLHGVRVRNWSVHRWRLSMKLAQTILADVSMKKTDVDTRRGTLWAYTAR